MGKLKASLIHLAISAGVFSIFLSLVFFIWYAYPFNLTQGIAEIVYIMAGVDVVLGPLLTAIIFKAGKKSLKFDLGVIAAMQIGALVYGASVIYQERPGYVVFAVDRFEVVGISEIDFKQSPISNQKVGFFERPKLIYAEKPTGEDVFELTMSIMAGTSPDIDRLPRFYRDFNSNQARVVEQTKPAAEIPVEVDDITRLAEYHFAPVVGKRRNIIALVDKNTGKPADYILADPWTKVFHK